MTIELSPALLSGYLLALARAGAWVFIVPPFGTRTLPMAVKAGLAAALALAVGPRLEAQAVPLEVGPLASAAVLQVGAGLALGFIGVLFFSAISLAGGLIDLFSGFSSAQLFDPSTSSASSLFGRFYSVLATTLLFAIDGHLLLTRGFLTSFDAAPLTSLNMADLAGALTDGAGKFFLAAVEIAAPLLAALFLAEVAMGLLARAAPHMNVFLLGLPIKILITLFLAGIALPLLPEAVSGLLDPIVRTGADVLN
jgi:flagellar biosynthetic protein FliR